MPRLWALSDLHLNYAVNRAAARALAPRAEDWLLVPGDIGETEAHLTAFLEDLVPKFAQVVWAPGNHCLWAMAEAAEAPVGERKYQAWVKHLRAAGVLTPEDPPVTVDTPGGRCRVMAVFGLYDYSFAPDSLWDAAARPAPTAAERERILAWAAEERTASGDILFLKTDPHPDIAAWCRSLSDIAQQRLAAVAAGPEPGLPIVLVTHYPTRRDLVRLSRIPRFVPWCGTRASEAWYGRHPLAVVVHGHLHIRASRWRDGVVHEEVSLGGPKYWAPGHGLAAYLREIRLPTAAQVLAPPADRLHP